nr:hypothetical protein CFP56_09105 [Quercus suber]
MPRRGRWRSLQEANAQDSDFPIEPDSKRSTSLFGRLPLCYGRLTGREMGCCGTVAVTTGDDSRWVELYCSSRTKAKWHPRSRAAPCGWRASALGTTSSVIRPARPQSVQPAKFNSGARGRSAGSSPRSRSGHECARASLPWSGASHPHMTIVAGSMITLRRPPRTSQPPPSSPPSDTDTTMSAGS